MNKNTINLRYIISDIDGVLLDFYNKPILSVIKEVIGLKLDKLIVVTNRQTFELQKTHTALKHIQKKYKFPEIIIFSLDYTDDIYKTKRISHIIKKYGMPICVIEDQLAILKEVKHLFPELRLYKVRELKGKFLIEPY